VTRIVCQQLAPRIADPPFNQAQTVGAIRQAVDAGADIVILPELATSGYVFASREEAASVALTPDDPLLGAWAAAAARGPSVVIGGFCERGDDGRLYNSAAVVDRSGVLGVYRKLHLWNQEKLFFEPGSAPPPVFDTPHGQIGVLICYDLEFPELTRMLALAGADLVGVPTNWPLVDRPANERPPEVIIAMAAARVNRMFVACCDRTGPERGQEWTAGTTIIDHEGWVLATQTDEGFAQADVELSEARHKRLTELADALGDRRPELYGPLIHATASPPSNDPQRVRTNSVTAPVLASEKTL
jgi:predicted amidohydrolase